MSKKTSHITVHDDKNFELLKTYYIYVHVIKIEQQLSFMEGPARLLQYEEVGVTELCLHTHTYVFSHYS